MTKKILVTGGAGYVGSTLVPVLLGQGFEVVVLDNLMYGGESLLGVWHHPNFSFIYGDITSADILEEIFTKYKIEAVAHLAAIVGDPACAKNPELAQRVNFNGSINLFEAAKAHGVKRFIFASTCSNYGKMDNPDVLIDENSPLKPVSLYAELKVRFERFLLDPVNSKEGFYPTALRFATVYGISPRMRFDLTVNQFTKELALGRALEVFGEQFWRPYCHVYDFARAICLVLNSDFGKVEYKAFNVGDTKENYQKQMIVEEIKKFIPNANVNYVHKNEDPRDYRVSFEKIKSTLGFEVSKRVPDGIREIKELLERKLLQNPDDSKYCNS